MIHNLPRGLTPGVRPPTSPLLRELLERDMNSSAWGAGACDTCRMAVLGGDTAPFVTLGDSSGPIFLHQCRMCGALWRKSIREAHVIAEEDARRDFPGVEIPERPP